MKQALRYVELKSGYSDDGPAWIGYATFSKSGRSVYFNGKILKRGSGISGNHFDLQTGEEYWVSGVKKSGTDRHYAGGGDIGIDKTAVEEYLLTLGVQKLPIWLRIVQLNNEPAKETAIDLENRKTFPQLDQHLRFKSMNELNSAQLLLVIEYYEGLDMTSIHKKARKEFIAKLEELHAERVRRTMQS